MNKRLVIASAGIIVVSLLVISIFVIRDNSSNTVYTGGSGELPRGYLTLTGYDEVAHNNPKIRLGEFFNPDQQVMIRSYLEEILYENNPKDTYKGLIIADSIDVDYEKNIIEFDIKLEDLPIIYTVRYDSVSDDITVLNEDKKEITPSAP